MNNVPVGDVFTALYSPFIRDRSEALITKSGARLASIFQSAGKAVAVVTADDEEIFNWLDSLV